MRSSGAGSTCVLLCGSPSLVFRSPQSCSTNTTNHQLPIPPTFPSQPLDTPVLSVTLETTLGRTLIPKSLSRSQQPFPWTLALLSLVMSLRHP